MNIDDIDSVGDFEFFNSEEFQRIGDVDVDVGFCDSNKTAKDRMLILMAFLFAFEGPPGRSDKKVLKNCEEKVAPWRFIEGWSDTMFLQQFRIENALSFSRLTIRGR